MPGALKTAGYLVGVVLAAGAFVARWGPLPGQVAEMGGRVSRVEQRQDRDGRKIAFTACRLADSTINQCLHHYTQP